MISPVVYDDEDDEDDEPIPPSIIRFVPEDNTTCEHCQGVCNSTVQGFITVKFCVFRNSFVTL